MQNLEWSYRPMSLEDVPAMLEWYNNRDLHEVANAKEFKPYTLEELTKYWEKKLDRTNARYFAILIDDHLVGRIGLKREEQSARQIEYSILIGDSSLYSRGLGTAITRQMLAEAFSDPQAELVQLSVRQDNKRAIRCYEKSGYRYAGSFIENGVPMIIMQVERKDYAVISMIL